MILSGGRNCVDNKTDSFVWFSPDGMGGLPGFAPWETHSLSETHNRLWKGSPDYLYNLTEVQNPNLFATQSYTTLIQTGPDEAIVIYNRYCELCPSTSHIFPKLALKPEIHRVDPESGSTLRLS